MRCIALPRANGFPGQETSTKGKFKKNKLQSLWYNPNATIGDTFVSCSYYEWRICKWSCLGMA